MLVAALPAVLVSTTAFAQLPSPVFSGTDAASQADPLSVSSDAIPEIPALHTVYGSGALPAQYRPFDSLPNALSYYARYNLQEPFTYDPAAGRLVTIKRGTGAQSNQLFVRYSDDLGHTWSPPAGPFYDGAAGAPRCPSIRPLATLNSSDTVNARYYFSFFTGTRDTASTFHHGFLNAAFTAHSLRDSSAGAGPASALTRWWGDSRSTATADGSTVLAVATMALNNIGICAFNRASGTMMTTIPPELSSMNYTQPPLLSQRTAVPVGMGRDNAGTIHLGIYARFPDREIIGRPYPYPAASISNDNGISWSPLEIVPTGVIQEYGQSQGAPADSLLFPFTRTQDFIVTGTGNFSFINYFVELNSERRGLTQIVEVFKENGAWGMRKVADVDPGVTMYEPVEPGGSTANKRGNEIQVSRTADGSGLLVTWVDRVRFILDEDLDNDGDQPDTLITTDIFMSVRTAGSTEWSDPVNITETPIIDRICWVPAIIPNSYRDIPVLTVQTRTDPVMDPTPHSRYLTAQRQIGSRPQDVMIFNVDLSSLAGISAEAIHGYSGNVLQAPFPNPSAAGSILRFTLARGGKISLDLWNVRGEHVGTIHEGVLGAGDHEVMMRTADLASGSYYYTLKCGNEILTRAFTISR